MKVLLGEIQSIPGQNGLRGTLAECISMNMGGS